LRANSYTDLADGQWQAKFWEPRAATSLSRLCHQQDKRDKAHQGLAPIYSGCPEGFDTAYLQEVEVLLEGLM
jgi:predicted ATPase